MKSRILLVDDHDLVRKGIRSLLDSDWEIFEATNGKEAVNKISELNPDLVILDLGMPTMGGTAAAWEIRRIAPQVKIMFLSMHASEAIGPVGKLVQADAYLSKGCSPETLRTTIAGLLKSP